MDPRGGAHDLSQEAASVTVNRTDWVHIEVASLTPNMVSLSSWVGGLHWADLVPSQFKRQVRPFFYMFSYPIQNTHAGHPDPVERIPLCLLLLIASQILVVEAFSQLGRLEWSWIGSVVVTGVFASICIRSWKSAGTEQRRLLMEPWAWWGPWAVVAALIAQILIYPTAMNDSLSYRLPRIYIWLQEGAVRNVDTADWRINSMTTGWESLALPFLSLNFSKGCRFMNLAMWMLVYQIIHGLARSSGAGIRKSGWIALALSLAPGFILQAPSTANDFFICGLVFIAVHFVLLHRHRPGPVPVLASLLAVVLASNVKPQFLLLGLAWLAWWLLGSNRPWKQVRWWLLVALSPFYVIVSPLLKLADNFLVSGSISGAPQVVSTNNLSFLATILANCVQFLFSQLQWPVMPGASGIDEFLMEVPLISQIQRAMPKFGPGLTEIPLVDSASLGFFHMGLVCIGCVTGWKYAEKESRGMLITGVLVFLLAASQVSVSTLGRSFMGFTVLALPLAIAGLVRLRNPAPLVFAIVAGAATLILNPSHPLWPCDLTESFLRKRGYPLTDKLGTYNLFRQRAFTGKGILEGVPHGATVSVLVRQITPITNLWRPDWRAHQIRFVHNLDVVEFEKEEIDWLIIGDKAVEQFPESSNAYRLLVQEWQRIRQIEYRPTIQQGPETWTLYRRPVK